MSNTKENDTNFEYNKYWIPIRPNFEDTTEYFESKELTRKLPHFYEPGDDITHRNAFTNCEITKKEFYDVQRKYNLVSEKTKRKHEELNRQWAELQQKELEFKNSFLFFEQFVQENDMKRKRAKTKLAEVSNISEIRTKDILCLSKQIEEYTKAKKEMDEAIAKLRKFEVKLYVHYISGV